MSTQTERQRIWNQRYRKRNPDRYNESNKRQQAIRRAATKAMRAEFRAEYDEAIDLDLTPAVRYRAAMKVLRERHPDEWARHLAEARKEYDR